MGVGPQATAGARPTARERILDTAYELFSRHGTRAVGVDRIIAESGIAKMTLYRNFPSKDDLILAFLERRDELWTRAWLQAEAQRRGSTAAERLLAIFDTFQDWFSRADFEGCSFINVMLEVDDPDNPVRRATVRHLAAIRRFVRDLAEQAGIDDADGFARQWHLLMKGCIVTAAEGDREAATRARQLGALLLAHHGVTEAHRSTVPPQPSTGEAHRVSPAPATGPAPPSTGEAHRVSPAPATGPAPPSTGA